MAAAGGSLVLAACALGLAAQPVPKLNSIAPEWVQSGVTNEVVLEGERLAQVTRFLVSGERGVQVESVPPANPAATVETSGGGIRVAGETHRRITVRVRASADAALGEREVRAVGPGGVSNPVSLNVGHVREVPEAGPNHSTNQAHRVELPAVLSGVIGEAAEVDYFRFSARKGQRLIFDVQANRSGSVLDSSLALLDAAGKELRRSEDDNGFDSFIDFTVPADGDYFLALRDFRFQGGGDYRYRLYAGELPYVDYFFPFGGRRGQEVELAVRGRNLDEVPKMKLFVEPTAPLGSQDLRLHTARGYSNARQFDVGDSQEFLETEPNNATNQANQVAVPAHVNGRIQGDKDVDMFKFKAEKGQTLVFEVLASRFGSPLDALLTLLDLNGNVLQRNDDAAGSDARLERRFDEAGEFLISVRDLLERNGEDYGYRLAISVPAPSFTARLLVDTPRLCRGGLTAVRVEVERLAGFGGGVEITGDGLPAGVNCFPLVITPELTGGTLMIAAAPDAPLGSAAFKLAASGVVAGRKLVHGVQSLSGDRMVKEAFVTVLEAAPFGVEPLTLSVTMEQEQSAGLEVLVRRAEGYREDIQLSLEGFSTGREAITRSVDTGPVTLRGYDTRATFNLRARLDAELGTRPIWVRAEGRAGGEPVVLVSRALPLTIREFPFALNNSLPRLLVTALPAALKSAASEAEFTVRVSRRGWFTDDISLALEGLPEGVTATSTNLPRNIAEAAFKLTATEKAPAGKDVSLFVVGTANVNGRGYQVRSPELKLTINPAPETNTVADATSSAK
jgi:hypothetical protein